MLIGIRVAEFSLHGRHTTDAYLNHTEGIGPNNLTDFTLCLRFNVNFLKPTTSSLLSYSTFLEDNAINVEVLKQSGGSLLFYVCKYLKREQVSMVIKYRLKKPTVIMQKMEHIFKYHLSLSFPKLVTSTDFEIYIAYSFSKIKFAIVE